MGTSAYTELIYNPEGQVVAMHDRADITQRTFFVGGRAFAKHQDGKTYFMHPNYLNSSTYVTDETGARVQKTLFGPYGELVAGSATTKDKRYAGMEQRESETDLDPTPARMYENRLYRWLSPDPGPWRFLNPQSYNAYAYGLNNPLRYVDTEGETAQDRVNAAVALLGVPYVSGGMDAQGLDCRGLVYLAYDKDPDNHLDLNPNHFDYSKKLNSGVRYQQDIFQTQGEYTTDLTTAQIGDALFFARPNEAVSHVGLVVDVKDGEIYFIQAAGTIDKPKWVKVDHINLANPKWGEKYAAGLGRPWTPRPAHSQREYLWYVWRLYTSKLVSSHASSPNSEPIRTRPVGPGCLQRRDGTCVQ